MSMGQEKFDQLAISGAQAAPKFAVGEASEPVQNPPIAAKSASWRWLLLLLTTCGLVGGLGLASLVSLLALPPATDCQKLTAISPDMERLFCAQEAARSGDLSTLLAGLDMLADWTPEHPLYNEAQRSMSDWSEAVLKVARQKASSTDLQEAVNLANRIPQSSPLYAEAQVAVTEWQQYWQRGELFYAQAQEALKVQDWIGVEAQIQQMREMGQDYWRLKRANALAQELLAEQQAQRTLSEAVSLAQTGQPGQIGAALLLASKMDAKTYAWKSLQPRVNQWSNALLGFGFEQWKLGNLDQAIAAGQRAFLDPGAAEEAQNLIKLSQARQLAMQSVTQWHTSTKDTIQLMEAIAAARQIKDGSRFYGTAQSSVKIWQRHLEDLQRLQVAQLTASLGQKDMLKLAIAQAEAITSERPRRVQAQTMIAHWTLEVQRQEDTPLLAQARQLAVPGTVPALRAAIAQAGRIAPGRALGQEAQGLIAEWNAQIQTIEDQPILARARSLARLGKLGDAIEVAQGVYEGRSLYWEAQRAISGWRADIRRAELARQRAEQEAMRERLQENVPFEEKQPELPTDLEAPRNTGRRAAELTPTPAPTAPASLSNPPYVNEAGQPVESAPPPPEVLPSGEPLPPLEAAPAAEELPPPPPMENDASGDLPPEAAPKPQ